MNNVISHNWIVAKMDFAKARKCQASFAELRKIRRVDGVLEGGIGAWHGLC